MKFARMVFAIGAGFGVVATLRLYFVQGTYLFYGLIAAVAAWQVVCFMISWDPLRFRPLMIPAVLEKLLWTITLATFYLHGELKTGEFAGGVLPHGLLGLLFVL